jgi:hypothetical protein
LAFVFVSKRTLEEFSFSNEHHDRCLWPRRWCTPGSKLVENEVPSAMGGATQSGDLQAFWIAEYFLTREDIDVDLLRELVASHESVFGDRRIQIRLLLRGAR